MNLNIQKIKSDQHPMIKFKVNSVSDDGKKITGNIVNEDNRKRGESKSEHKWCREHDACIVCGSSKLKHTSAGVCAGCYSPLKVKAVKSGVDPKKLLGATSKKMRELMGEDTSQPRNYYCNDCENEFKSDKNTIDVVCPNCKSIHVGLVK
jgi:predicted Zn-ribbon and HTH transcriptional regulator